MPDTRSRSSAGVSYCAGDMDARSLPVVAGVALAEQPVKKKTQGNACARKSAQFK